LLESIGFQVDTVDQRLGLGATDKSIALLAQNERRVIFTIDKGFSDIREYPFSDYSGIVVIRIKPLSTRRINRALVHFFRKISITSLSAGLFIISNTGIRTRR
jgi:predicted nuclease of predicted toxin-antitoxin system